MLMSVTPVNAWIGVIPPSAGDAEMLSKRQTDARHERQQEAGQPDRFIIMVVYFSVS